MKNGQKTKNSVAELKYIWDDVQSQSDIKVEQIMM